VNSFLQKLTDQRKRFLEGLDANEGDINLDIFEDFYPDQAHFVFELLQNAEDAGATEVVFNLTTGGCLCEHDGKRAFTEDDVRSITGIYNSTKSKAPDQIGKFGVGFKSVFVYTLAPTVRSGAFSFKISRYVLPEPIQGDPTIGNRTRFELPFNNPKKTPENAYAEIKTGLSELAETTLLFLSNLESISWRIGQDGSGEVLRVQHSENHLEMLKQSHGKTTTSSHFLKFDQPVEGLVKQRVAVAFELDLLPNVEYFDAKMPLARQGKIIPATPGRVAVFFPAEKETSGLRFHLHGPFVPELSRASIKETPANQPLFRQLAALTAASLHQIRDMGLLTAEFLSVLPNAQDPLPPRYQGVRAAIVDEMNTQPLTPTHSKSYAPARHLLQAKGVLKDLLSEEDIEFLVDHDEEPPQWVIGAPQKNSNADRFLTGLAITEWDIKEFVELLIRKAPEGRRFTSSPPYFVTGPDQTFMAWLSAKPMDWHQKLYSLLYVELSPDGGCRGLAGLKLVRLSDGSYSVGSKCFFPSDRDQQDDALPRVDVGAYTSGKSKTQQENARKLLEEIGVRKVGEAEQIEAILKQRYTSAASKPNKQDLKRFIALTENDPTKASLFGNYFIFEGKDTKWRKPSGVFLDQPFVDTGLSAYYDARGADATREALAERYADSGIAVKRLVKFAEAVGAQTRLEITETHCASNPRYEYLQSVDGKRYGNSIDRDYVITGLEEVLAKPSLAISKLVWLTMCSLPLYPDYLRATYQVNQRGGARRADSQLVHHLRRIAWVPQGRGPFVRPADASRDMLPEGFPFDPGWMWLKSIAFGQEVIKKSDEQRQKEAVAKELGFPDSESLERAKRFAALSLKEQERILADREPSEALELPEHEPAEPGRRAERVAAQAADAPERSTEERTRSVSIGREEVKQEAEQYLRQQYTNADGDMICQVCKALLPFKLDDGNDYFEKVEFLPELKKRYYQNYLALSPNHAAMFQHANGSADSMRDVFAELTGNELEVVLAQKDATVYFTKTHIADLKEAIKVDRAEPVRSPGEIRKEKSL
jgi:hypothetical protein